MLYRFSGAGNNSELLQSDLITNNPLRQFLSFARIFLYLPERESERGDRTQRVAAFNMNDDQNIHVCVCVCVSNGVYVNILTFDIHVLDEIIFCPRANAEWYMKW